MINSSTAASPVGYRERTVLRMVRDDSGDSRMAGSVPVWGASSATDASAVEPASGGTFASALSYAEQPHAEAPQEERPFGFGDLIDIVNPLQHIPIVSHLYRNLTGDTINPASRVIGDTLFGGPVGGAASLANVIVEDQTGHDITDTIMTAMTGEKSEPVSKPADSPERRLTDAVTTAMAEDGVPSAPELPGTVLSLADLGNGKRVVEADAAPAVSYGASYWHLNE